VRHNLGGLLGFGTIALRRLRRLRVQGEFISSRTQLRRWRVLEDVMRSETMLTLTVAGMGCVTWREDRFIEWP